MSSNLPELYALMPWSVCSMSGLSEVIDYLLHSKFLSVPQEWIDVFVLDKVPK